MSEKTMHEKIKRILEDLNQNIYEREEIMALSLLGALSHQNVFMLGLPGVAKSLIARRIASVFQGEYFEYLMNKFSAPEDLFGPVSIEALKNEQFSRKTEGFLPSADFAFLDEIWKSSPAILNALLTISNERKYKNGAKNMDVPLTYIISASNETPPPNQGLEALYDRFPIRIFVNPIQENNNRMAYLQNNDTMEFIPKETLSPEDVKRFNQGVATIKMSDKALECFTDIVDQCHELEENPIYISDRRQKQLVNILRYAALYSGHDGVEVSQLVLLKYCMWDKDEDRTKIEEIVGNALLSYLMPEGFDLDTYKEEFNKTNDEIIDSLFEDTLGYQELANLQELSCYDDQDVEHNQSFCVLTDSNGREHAYNTITKEFWSVVAQQLDELVGVATISKSHQLTLPQYNIKIQLTPTSTQKIQKKGLSYNQIEQAVKKADTYTKSIEKTINSYEQHTQKTLENVGNFVVGESLNFLNTILESNKVILEGLKVEIDKLTQKVKSLQKD
ncbi:MAG: AAA family ATPase [Brevinema sp.]